MVHSIFCFGVKLQSFANCSISSKNKDSDASLPSNFGAALLFHPGIDFPIIAGMSAITEFKCVTGASGVGVLGKPDGQSALEEYSSTSSDRIDEISSPSLVDVSELGVVDLYISKFSGDTGFLEIEDVLGNQNPSSGASIVPKSVRHLKRSR